MTTIRAIPGRLALRAERDARWLAKGVAQRLGRHGETYFEHRVPEYRGIWQRVAAARGATFTDLAADLWQLELDGRRFRVMNHELPFDDPVTLGVAGRKLVVHRLLADAGIRVPEHAGFDLDSLDVARRFVAAQRDGAVVKPANGYGGKGVTTHVQRPEEIRRAAVRAAVYGSGLMIERMIPGASYRLLVLDRKVVDVVVRGPLTVVGDGRSTVAGLTAAAGERTGRAGVDVEADRELSFTLRTQGLTPASVPDDGRLVIVRYAGAPARAATEVRTVYTSRATEIVCEAIVRDAETAANVIGSDFLGVDVITTDPGRPLEDTGGVINEVNTTPALHHHYDASTEAYPTVALQVFDALLARAPSTAESSP